MSALISRYRTVLNRLRGSRIILAAGFVACLAVAWPASSVKAVAAAQLPPQAEGSTQIPGGALQPIATAVVDFAELGRRERARGPFIGPEAQVTSGFILEEGE